MQKEMSVAEQEIGDHETGCSSGWKKPTTLAAELKAAEAALKSEQAEIARERQAARSRARRPRTPSCSGRREERAAVAAQLSPRSAGDLRARRPRPQGARGGRSARRPLHRLPRPAAAAGVQRGPAQRQHHPVRQLHPHPLLRAGAGAAAPTPQPLLTSDDSSRTSTAAPAAIPGPAGYGVRIEAADGTLIEELHGGLGIATNNVAEYNGLLAALQWAVDHGHAGRAHPRRLGAAREADARRVQGQASGPAAARRPRAPARRATRRVTFRARAPRAEQGSRPAVEPGHGRSRGRAESGEGRAHPATARSRTRQRDLVLTVTRCARMTPSIRPAPAPFARYEWNTSGYDSRAQAGDVKIAVGRQARRFELLAVRPPQVEMTVACRAGREPSLERASSCPAAAERVDDLRPHFAAAWSRGTARWPRSDRSGRHAELPPQRTPPPLPQSPASSRASRRGRRRRQPAASIGNQHRRAVRDAHADAPRWSSLTDRVGLGAASTRRPIPRATDRDVDRRGPG